MAERSTFIKLDRGIQNWRWYQNPNTFRVFIHILLNANVESRDFMDTTIHRGEMATSYARIGDSLGLTIQQVRTAISHLKSTEEITVKQQSKFLIISVLNYAKYQDRLTDNQQAINSQLTVNQQSVNSQSTTIKECKEYKECKECKEVVSTDTASPTATSEQDLIRLYGIEATERYKKRFESWAKKKDAKVECIPTIAGWMAKDKVPKKTAEVMSSFDLADVENAILSAYD